MLFAARTLRRVLVATLALTLAPAAATPLLAAEKPRIRVQDYVIDASVSPMAHKISAHARVKFSALDDISIATFELHNALRVTRVAAEDGTALTAERVSQDSTVRVALPNGLAKGQEMTLIFDYEGIIQNSSDSPVPGLSLAYIGDPASYLLYAGRWFPMSGYGTDRFSAIMRITVPTGYTVIGSGKQGDAGAAQPVSDLPVITAQNEPKLRHQRHGQKEEEPKPAQAPLISGGKTFVFTWDKPSFPGSIFIGKYTDTAISEAGLTIHVYFLQDHAGQAQEYGETAAKEFAYFTTLYGVPLSHSLRLVQIPDDSVPAAWAPDVAALSSRAIGYKLNYRLLANMIAHQWWGVDISPKTRNDWWVEEGGARYSETRYIEFAAGRAGADEAIKDMCVGALAYENVPLAQAGTLDPFDPVFQSLVTDKGGMVFHMLRWVLGEAKYDDAIRNLMTQFAGQPVSAKDLSKVSEQQAGEQMLWFFSQWLDSTGAPEFKNKYTIFRVAKGFRVVGHIEQDLDLFKMPVELKIDTDGKTEIRNIDVVGMDSPYSVETFGKPRRITLDPDNWVLKNSPELKLRTAIMRGQQMVQQGNLVESLREFQKALDINRNSSLAHYRVAEVFYQQRNYQAAANAYRDALNGDGEPRWTEVWAHIQLGKIFDITGQRERALNEYKQALQTNDNTQGALDEARKYLQAPYQRSDDSGGN